LRDRNVASFSVPPRDRLWCKKYPLKDSTVKKCDEPALPLDKATGYVTNTGGSFA
jgi:hypothetical protein